MEFKEIFSYLLMEKTGGNQTLLSKESGIPIPTINGWLTKGRLPRAEQLIKLSEYFNVSADYLLGLDSDDLPGKKIPENINSDAKTTRRSAISDEEYAKNHFSNLEDYNLYCNLSDKMKNIISRFVSETSGQDYFERMKGWANEISLLDKFSELDEESKAFVTNLIYTLHLQKRIYRRKNNLPVVIKPENPHLK